MGWDAMGSGVMELGTSGFNFCLRVRVRSYEGSMLPSSRWCYLPSRSSSTPPSWAWVSSRGRALALPGGGAACRVTLPARWRVVQHKCRQRQCTRVPSRTPAPRAAEQRSRSSSGGRLARYIVLYGSLHQPHNQSLHVSAATRYTWHTFHLASSSLIPYRPH